MTHTNSTPANPIPPGWPDPLESPQAEAIRNGKLDDTEIRNLFDCMERELRLHRERAANQAQVTDAMVKAIKAKWAAMRQLGDPNEHALASAAIAAIGAGEQAVEPKRSFEETFSAEKVVLDHFFSDTHPAPSGQAQGVIRQIIEDALNSAIPEPWEVAEHATQRILAAIGAGNEPFQLVEESDEVGTQMVVASAIGAGGQASGAVTFYDKDNCPVCHEPDGQAVAELRQIEEMLDAGQGDDDGPQIMPDFEPGMSTLAKVEACLFLLEKRRDVIEAFAHPVQPEWREMDSAPKDGTEILVCGPAKDGGAYREVQRWPKNWSGKWPVSYMAYAAGEPTRWMPIPTAPQLKGE